MSELSVLTEKYSLGHSEFYMAGGVFFHSAGMMHVPPSYLLSGVNWMCVLVLCGGVPYLVCSPHTGWRTSVVFSWLQNPCWRQPGYATSQLLYAAALLAAPLCCSVKKKNVHSVPESTNLVYIWILITEYIYIPIMHNVMRHLKKFFIRS